MSFRELQKRCVDLKLFPCARKGVTRDVLAEKIRQYEEGISGEIVEGEVREDGFSSVHEEQIYRHDPSFYESYQTDSAFSCYHYEDFLIVK